MNNLPLSPFSLPRYEVRILTTADLPTLQDLLERCADFHLLVLGQPPQPGDAAALLENRPPNISPDDKTVLGIFSPGGLIAVLDLARNYPQPGIWWIGLLLIDSFQRGNGLGRRIYAAFETWAHQHGAREIRLGVVERNEKALRLWKSLGFQQIDQRPPAKMGLLEQSVYVLRKIPPDG